MPNPVTDRHDIPGLAGPPWTRPRTVYFYGGWLSNFSPTPGRELPYGSCGHREPGRVEARRVAHWVQAVALRADWEQVKYEVMLRALAGKFAAEPYRSGLLLTDGRPLAEDSPTDFVWGARDPQGGYGGQNLLGQALMAVRAALIADTMRELGELGSASGCAAAAGAVRR